jgi:hypothetical protein
LIEGSKKIPDLKSQTSKKQNSYSESQNVLVSSLGEMSEGQRGLTRRTNAKKFQISNHKLQKKRKTNPKIKINSNSEKL